MKKTKINILLIVFFSFIISCNGNSEYKEKYLIYDLHSRFPTLLEEDSLILFSTSKVVFDSMMIKSNRDNVEILGKQLQRSLINSDSLTYIILFKTNEEAQNIYQFYFDENYNFLKVENKE